MGTRLVEVEKSSQGELMQNLFPRAKCIIWDDDTGVPILIKNTIDEYCTGFRKFLTSEELLCFLTLSKNPGRVSFITLFVMTKDTPDLFCSLHSQAEAFNAPMRTSSA